VIAAGYVLAPHLPELDALNCHCFFFPFFPEYLCGCYDVNRGLVTGVNG
jgi:hypothetical protein